jgi:hypothetical protein
MKVRPNRPNPFDCHCLCFAHAVNEDSLIGCNPVPVDPVWGLTMFNFCWEEQPLHAWFVKMTVIVDVRQRSRNMALFCFVSSFIIMTVLCLVSQFP